MSLTTSAPLSVRVLQNRQIVYLISVLIVRNTGAFDSGAHIIKAMFASPFFGARIFVEKSLLIMIKTKTECVDDCLKR